MSVIFSSGKKSVKKFKEGAHKTKKTHTSVAAVSAKIAKPTPPKSYLPSSTTVVWNHKVNDIQISMALNKDTMQLWCNDQIMRTDSQFVDDGTDITFVIQDRKGLIEIRRQPIPPPLNGAGGFAAIAMAATSRGPQIVYQMFVDGQSVPEFSGGHSSGVRK